LFDSCTPLEVGTIFLRVISLGPLRVVASLADMEDACGPRLGFVARLETT
jgi:hypothetical protein